MLRPYRYLLLAAPFYVLGLMALYIAAHHPDVDGALIPLLVLTLLDAAAFSALFVVSLVRAGREERATDTGHRHVV